MLSDEMVAHLTRDGRPAEREAIRYVGFGGNMTTAGDVDQQDVDHFTGGPPPEGKEGELDAAQRLIDWRNRQGERGSGRSCGTTSTHRRRHASGTRRGTRAASTA